MSQELHVVLGTGPLGLSVMRELVKRGKRVRMVNRSGRAQVPVGVEVVAGDVYQTENVRVMTEGALVVYQCAQPGYTQWATHFPPLQTAIIEGVADSGAKLVVGENLYMYGEVDGPIHEGLPYKAHTKKGKVRAQMAEQVLEAHRTGKVRTTSARASDFYGAGVEGSSVGDRVFGPLVQGKAAQAVGNVDLPHTYTVIDDFGKVMVILGEDDRALGQAWHVPNPPTITTRELLAIAAQQAGVAPKINTMGRLMLTIGGLFIPEAKEGIEMLYEFEKPFVVDHQKFARTFGEFYTPHDAALRDTVAWYQSRIGISGHR